MLSGFPMKSLWYTGYICWSHVNGFVLLWRDIWISRCNENQINKLLFISRLFLYVRYQQSIFFPSQRNWWCWEEQHYGFDVSMETETDLTMSRYAIIVTTLIWEIWCVCILSHFLVTIEMCWFMSILPISIPLTSLALGKWHDCHNGATWWVWVLPQHYHHHLRYHYCYCYYNNYYCYRYNHYYHHYRC